MSRFSLPILAFTLIPGVRGVSLHDQIIKDLAQFNSANWQDRETAFKDLASVGCPVCAKSQFPIVDGIDNARKRSSGDAESISTALIALLETEEAFQKTQPSLSEECTNYLGDLTMVISVLHDPRAVDELYGVIDTGNTAQNGLARLGDTALDKMSASLADRTAENVNHRVAVMRVFAKMAEQRNLQRFSNPEQSREVIKRTIINGLNDSDQWMRLAAVEGTVNLGDKDLIPQLDKLTAEDSYVTSQGVYLIRLEAQKAVEKLSTK